MNYQARPRRGHFRTVDAASIAPPMLTPSADDPSAARNTQTPAQTNAPNPLSKCLDFGGTIQHMGQIVP